MRMRYVRIFLLYFQDAFASRSRSFVWFLITLVNPLIYLLFWKGALSKESVAHVDWSLSTVASYYFFLIIAGAFLMVHIEENIAYYDIQEGWLSNYLTKPFSYYGFKFFQEIPYRILQGFFGVLVFASFWLLFGRFAQVVATPEGIALSIVILILAYIISFTFKMLLGLSALWTTDFSGMAQFVGVVILLFGGFIAPLDFFPDTLRSFVFVTPFPYIFYYSILSFQGQLTMAQQFGVIAVQGMWAVGLCLVYLYVWKIGIKKFTGVGQ